MQSNEWERGERRGEPVIDTEYLHADAGPGTYTVCGLPTCDVALLVSRPFAPDERACSYCIMRTRHPMTRQSVEERLESIERQIARLAAGGVQ